MATDVKLPRLGQGMESGVIVRWLKSEGEPVAKGEPLYELDTDKVTQEVESELDGVLTRIVVAEGDVEVGATVAVIESNGAGVVESADADSTRRPTTRAAEDGKSPEAEHAAPRSSSDSATAGRAAAGAARGGPDRGSRGSFSTVPSRAVCQPVRVPTALLRASSSTT